MVIAHKSKYWRGESSYSEKFGHLLMFPLTLHLSTDQKIWVNRLLELEEEISEKITGNNSQSLYKAKNSSYAHQLTWKT